MGNGVQIAVAVEQIGEVDQTQMALPDQPDDLPARIATEGRGRPRLGGTAQPVDGGVNGSALPALAGDDGLLADQPGGTPTERLQNALRD